MGLDMMAEAGFAPRAWVALWRNLAAASGAVPPALLSTHPASASRIQSHRGPPGRPAMGPGDLSTGAQPGS
ncbi:MAG: M48 family metalloprotease [Gammaproteobacteria bacterium]